MEVIIMLICLLNIFLGFVAGALHNNFKKRHMSNLVVQDDPDNPSQPYIFLELSRDDLIRLQAHDPETVIFNVKYNKYRKNSKG